MEDVVILGVGMHPWGKWGRILLNMEPLLQKKL